MAIRMKKYSSQNLTCFHAKDEEGNDCYQIWENGKMEKPIAIYFTDGNSGTGLQLSDSLPLDMNQYQHLDEFCEILKFLMSCSEEREWV